ncbi:MAG TPA: hypothetical protein VL329_10265, partial [Nitrospiraceae bacterium]|nr:hypothetical protein [Nitrospiraceae bacterium]
MRDGLWMVVLALVLFGCAASKPMAAERTLTAPAYAIPEAAAAMEEGNRLFSGRQFETAKL